MKPHHCEYVVPRPVRRAFLAAALLLASANGFADDIYWVGTQADCTGVVDVGSFFHDDNWLNFAHPEAPDTALFGSGIDPDPPDNPRTIYFGDACFVQGICSERNIFGGDAISQNLAVQSGDWTFDFRTLSLGCLGPPGQSTGNYIITEITWIGMPIDATGLSGTAVLTLAGPGELNAGALFIGVGDGITAGHGRIIVRDGATLRSAGGVLAALPGSSGFVEVQGAASTWISNDNIAIGNNGVATLDVSGGGTVVIDGQISVAEKGSGSIGINAGSLVQAATTFLNPNGLLGGTGSVVGHVVNAGGICAPGASPGTLTIDGNYTQQSNGTLEIEIGGTTPGEFDQLVVTGDTQLDGILNVTFRNGFRPNRGDVFLIISSKDLTGTFSRINAPSGVVFEPTFGSGGVSMEATSVSAVPTPTHFGVPVQPMSPLNNDAATDETDDFFNVSATDSHGTWVTFWMKADEMTPNTQRILLARSIDDGLSWSDPQIVANSTSGKGADQTSISVATDDAGEWMAVWAADESLGGVGDDEDIVLVRSADNGETWSAPTVISPNPASTDRTFTPLLATDKNGVWLVFWEVSPGGFHISRSENNGDTWSPPVPLVTNQAFEAWDIGNNAGLVTDERGTWLAVWSAQNLPGLGSDWDLVFVRSADNGLTWSDPGALNTTANNDDALDWWAGNFPPIATDRRGNWIAVWTSENDLNETIGNDRDVLWSRSTDNGSTWSDPRALNNDAVTDATRADQQTTVATDSLGNWVAAWRSSGNTRIARSTDLGTTWTEPIAISPETATPVLTSSESGTWVLTGWWLAPPGFGSDLEIFFTRFALGQVIPDFDGDSDVDFDDYFAFQNCVTGPEPADLIPNCRVFDSLLDGDVDLLDFAWFQVGFSGSGP